MIREETKKAIEIMQAYVDGKEIQIKVHNSYYDIEPTWDWDDDVELYRIKSEPKLRPYKNQEEFLKAMREHDGWLLHIDNGFATVPVYVDNLGIDLIGGGTHEDDYGYERIQFNELLKLFTWVDGTPCGRIEDAASHHQESRSHTRDSCRRVHPDMGWQDHSIRQCASDNKDAEVEVKCL